MPSNFNSTTPAAPAGGVNVIFQTDGNENNSAYLPSSAMGTVTTTGSPITGDLAIFSGATSITSTTLLPNGTVATTQAPMDDSQLVATTQYVDAAIAAGPGYQDVRGAGTGINLPNGGTAYMNYGPANIYDSNAITDGTTPGNILNIVGNSTKIGNSNSWNFTGDFNTFTTLSLGGTNTNGTPSPGANGCAGVTLVWTGSFWEIISSNYCTTV